MKHLINFIVYVIFVLMRFAFGRECIVQYFYYFFVIIIIVVFYLHINY